MTPPQIIAELLNENLPFKKEIFPSGTYLVGGAVRDGLLKRKRAYFDLDFVVPDRAIDLAKQISKTYKAGFVVLDREREIARVVFKQGTVDIARQEGNSLEKDLGRRDFTINAIAYQLDRDELIDPFHGVEDLNDELLRMISQANLEDDPLRLLRAYRQAAQLDFAIESKTRNTISNLAHLITTVAAERVNTEFGYLLTSLIGSKWIVAAWRDGLLKPWFPEVNVEKLARLIKIDEAIVTLKNKYPDLIQDYSWSLSISKLASLVVNLPEKAELELIELKYSRNEIRAVTTALKYLSQLQLQTNLMSLREQYFFFLNVKDVFPILAILAVATEANWQITSSLCDRYINHQDPVAHPQILVSGNDLMEALNLKPSPKIGELLTEIQIAHIEGKISNAEDAIAWVRIFQLK
jgi:tRNA nucleotidyltransferase (CCA-adding enzyme)